MDLLFIIARIMKKNYFTNICLVKSIPLYLIISSRAKSFPVSHLFKYRYFNKYCYPKVLAIFLTTRCNLECFICRRENFSGQDMDFDNILNLRNAIKNAKIIDLTGWGEATIYPHFNQILSYIYSLNNRKNLIRLTTNGTRLSDEIASALKGHLYSITISLNAATEGTYNRDMRYGNFVKTTTNIKTFMHSLGFDEKKKVRLHFVAHTENYREIPKFVELAYELGVSHVSVGQYLVSIESHKQYSLLEIKKEYNAIIDLAGEKARVLGVSITAPKFVTGFLDNGSNPNIVNTTCISPFNECFILPNGDVAPCCYSGNEFMGNAYKEGFESVWFGPKYQKLRKERYLDACKRCIPFVPFDSPLAHFTEEYKKK